MKNKILIPLFIISALAAFYSFKYTGNTEVPDDRKKQIIQSVIKVIQQTHLSPREMNDSFSVRVFNKVFNNLDYDKRLYTQQDMDALEKYRYILDNGDGANMVDFYNSLNAIYNKRMADVEGYYTEAIAKTYTFDTDESLNLSGEKIAYAKSDAELKDRWVKYVKYRVLMKYVELKDGQQKRVESKDTSLKKVLTDIQLEADARTAVKKSMDLYFKRMHKVKEEDRFAVFVNSITGTEDPHTDYFPPDDKKEFDEAMSGTFFGIGAQLRDEDGKTKIVAVMTGYPAWKQGDLKAGDEVIKVAQGDSAAVDIQGFEINDVIKLIKGPKGTTVKLTVRHTGGAIQTIPIIRDKVEREETFAKSVLINSPKGPVGYIFLPEFYADFQHMGANGRRCSDDVALEVLKLKKAGVQGIILDLRNNGGGSLNDVVSMGGLFVDQGPIVQVKQTGAAAMQLDDPQKGTLYDGPMAIMVNIGSASASEIMAAAMQDYKRAVIVGSTTFGKGTVQKVLSLDEFNNWMQRATGKPVTDDSLGSIKITIQKFYRINGGSTQLKGVIPDIVLPDPYSDIDLGERHDKAALAWDEIPAAKYTPANAVNTQQLAALSKSRVAANPSFDMMKQTAARYKKLENENVVSLNEKKYRKELEEANAISKKLDELEKKNTALNITNLADDLPKINIDSTNINRNEAWLKMLKKDMYLSETVNIVADMIKQKSHVDMETGMK
jgi:carboxyl-terminal processing protease